MNSNKEVPTLLHFSLEKIYSTEICPHYKKRPNFFRLYENQDLKNFVAFLKQNHMDKLRKLTDQNGVTHLIKNGKNCLCCMMEKKGLLGKLYFPCNMSMLYDTATDVLNERSQILTSNQVHNYPVGMRIKYN